LDVWGWGLGVGGQLRLGSLSFAISLFLGGFA
jgi:hypothetical protein